jgi:glycosyltransferase involved in cell wall biosynthesis
VAVRFSIVMTVFETFSLLPRALSCVAQQTLADWELLVVVDGPAPLREFAPLHLVRQMRKALPRRRIDVWELPRSEGCHGNVGRNFALDQARGDYVCWVNHDNLIAPGYLAAHQENIDRRPGCLSVVDVDLWKRDRFHGRYPRRYAASQIDLLCFAIPLAVAREVNAFGGAMSRVYAADWLTFNACRKLIPIEHNRKIVGTHF